MSITARTCEDYAAQVTRDTGIPIHVKREPGNSHLVHVQIEGTELGFLSSPIMVDAYLMGIYDLAAFLKPAKTEGDLP